MEYTDVNKGLSAEQAERLKAEGHSNGSFEIKTKSVGQIFKDNIFTLFNLINLVLAVMIFITGSYRNMLFMGVVLCNTAIGIFQEIRSKRVIDKLSLISAPKAKLIRDGKELVCAVSEIVKGDIMLISAGQQVCADCLVLQGGCEADESLITGEQDPIEKSVGEELLSGSFIVSGSVRAQAVRVGAESTSNKITSGAKYIKKPNSEMMRAINKIISVVSVCIFPFGAVLLAKSLLVLKQTFELGVVSTAAALIGMIPEGLVLLTSVALALSTIRLAQKKTLCQDLYCVESLARVDVLCLDKTGTITEGKMELNDAVFLENEQDVKQMLSAFCSAFEAKNASLAAIEESFGKKDNPKAIRTVPFSSERKWSGAEFNGFGTLILGAPNFVLKDNQLSKISDIIGGYSEKGMRVLVLAQSKQALAQKSLPEGLKAAAVIVLSDKIRDSAHETLAYFKEQGVALKVISGDDPHTVSQVAMRAGLDNAESYIDASTLNETELAEAAERYTVFGRVTPYQKLALVKAMKERGHKVAMTGDGVNDVLALKEADCSIAMQSGSDAARSVSQLVLLNSDFSSLPQVVYEGRRTINNIQRSSALFLVKTILSFLLSAVFLVLPLSYPFRPIQMTLISALMIGIPSFLLALEPNKNKVSGTFAGNIIRNAAPGGISAVIGIILLLVFQKILGASDEQLSTMATILTAAVCYGVVACVCKPMKLWHGILLALIAAAFVGAAVIFGELFYFVPLGITEWVALAAIIGIALILMAALKGAAEALLKKRK